MGSPKDTYHHGDLYNALVGSAVRLIEQEGCEGFSLREAAREVGVSANAAYRHFADKSALLAAVAADGFQRLSRRMQKAIGASVGASDSEGAAVARFKAIGRAYVGFALTHPELFRLMFGPRGVDQVDAAPGENPTPSEPTPYELLGQALDALVAEGRLPAERRSGAELKAWTVVHGFATLALNGRAAIPTGRARTASLESVLHFALVGLCAEVPSCRGIRSTAERTL